MKAPRLRLLALSSLGLLGACAADEGPKGPLTVAVAPLTLPGIADVCYGLTVFNGDPSGSPDTVWSLEGICSSQYGNTTGGDITYIGTCDADTGGENNYVQLILETIEDDQDYTLLDQNTVPFGGDSDFINPCADPGDCILDFPCVENEDVFVEFNITVMRDAEQGFFDIAVNFEDVFCSAKADSCYGEDDNITLLFGDDENDTLGRDHTLVVGFACTAGPDYVNTQGNIIPVTTQLLMSMPAVTCTDSFGFPHLFEIPLTGSGGNGTVDNGDYKLEFGVYFDDENLTCGSVQDDVQATDASDRPLFGKDGEYYATYSDIDGRWTLFNLAGEVVGSSEGGPNDADQLKFNVGGLSVGPYFDSTDLSCNKSFFNFAINIENLAGQGLRDCKLNFDATAQNSAVTTPVFDIATGDFLDDQGVYGAVRFADVHLTDASAATVCDAHPLNGDNFDGDESNVTSQYVFGDAYSNSTAPLDLRYQSTQGAAAVVIPVVVP